MDKGGHFMEKNIGTIDAYIRITLGFIMLGGGIMKKSPAKIVVGSWKLAEGMTRFCPMLYVFGMNTNHLDKVLPIKKSCNSKAQLFRGL